VSFTNFHVVGCYPVRREQTSASCKSLVSKPSVKALTHVLRSFPQWILAIPISLERPFVTARKPSVFLGSRRPGLASCPIHSVSTVCRPDRVACPRRRLPWRRVPRRLLWRLNVPMGERRPRGHVFRPINALHVAAHFPIVTLISSGTPKNPRISRTTSASWLM
jgi:hypothetical protein